LDISCPALVMCPSASWDAPGGSGGLLTARVLPGGRATMRLGAHVTWLKLEGALPGQALPDGPDRRRFFDELGRWLGAYLSGQGRDQLLCAGPSRPRPGWARVVEVACQLTVTCTVG